MTQKLSALKGTQNFMQLMAFKPLASLQNVSIHATYATVNQNTKSTTEPAPFIRLGQIVPKKLFPLAVDRNRVRRLVRAHIRGLVQTANADQNQSGLPPPSLSVLVRLKPHKSNKKSKSAINETSKNAIKIGFLQAENNPQSRRFALALRTTIDQAMHSLVKKNEH